jgi:F-type H+-transporting ATPase subunit alpha
VILFAGTNGYADDIPVDQMENWKVSLLRYIETSHADLVRDISEKLRMTDETQESLHTAIKTFNSTWQ